MIYFDDVDDYGDDKINFLKKIPASKLHPREKQIITELALGTFDPDNIIGADLIAIRNGETMLAIQPIWIEKRTKDWVGKEGWKHIHYVWTLKWMNLYPGFTREVQEEVIGHQEQLIEDERNN